SAYIPLLIVSALFLSLLHPPPTTTLFPYTTLFRSFHYIPDPNLINAFALPGGHVFIGRGMLDLMTTEDQLATVLGHEVEHIDLRDRKSTRLNSSHQIISYAVFCLKKKTQTRKQSSS